MTRKQLAALGICYFATFTVGNSLTGLMPVYLTRLGADSTVTGLYMAVVFLSMAISTLVGGQLSDRLQKRKALLILGGVVAAPTAWLMSGTTAIVPLVILNALLWFAGGTISTMVNILAGLFSESGDRGRVFGILGLTINLGLLSGAIISGPIADRLGYPALFVISGFFYLLIPVAGLFMQDKPVVRIQTDTPKPILRSIITNRTFMFLFVAGILAQLANSLMVMGRPMIMDIFHFDATTITTAGAIGVLATFPLPLIIGWLSDRLGRKPFIIICYLTTTLGLISLATAATLWQFWVASALQSILGISLVVGSALVTDMFPKESLGTPLSLLNTTPWIGFVIGFSAGGAAISALQMTPTLLLGVMLSVVSILLLIPVSARKPVPQPAEAA